MRHAALRVLAFIALTMPAVAPAAERPPLPDVPVSDGVVPADPMPERQTLWSNPRVALYDVEYLARPGYRALHLDLYRPTEPSAPRPLVVFVHGGGFGYANPRAAAAFRNFPLILANLVERGYVVASVEYRFSKEAPLPAQMDDVRAALTFLRSNADHFGIDARRVAAWGMSAGAFLVAHVAMDCVEPACVQGWVGWFGGYDLTTRAGDGSGDSDLRAFLGCATPVCTPENLARVSPITYADGRDPPALLVHGTADTGPSPQESERLARRLREAGATADLLLIPGVRHGLAGADDATTKAALRQACTATFEFFDRVLRASAAPASTP